MLDDHGNRVPTDIVNKVWEDAADADESPTALPAKHTVRYDEATREFKDMAGEVLGRISQCRVGTDDEQLSVYCRLHQCSYMIRTKSTAESLLKVTC